MSRLSTKNYNPRATGSLRHFMLKVFYAVLKTESFSVNSSTLRRKQAQKSKIVVLLSVLSPSGAGAGSGGFASSVMLSPLFF